MSTIIINQRFTREKKQTLVKYKSIFKLTLLLSL